MYVTAVWASTLVFLQALLPSPHDSNWALFYHCLDTAEVKTLSLFIQNLTYYLIGRWYQNPQLNVLQVPTAGFGTDLELLSYTPTKFLSAVFFSGSLVHTCTLISDYLYGSDSSDRVRVG